MAWRWLKKSRLRSRRRPPPEGATAGPFGPGSAQLLADDAARAVVSRAKLETPAPELAGGGVGEDHGRIGVASQRRGAVHDLADDPVLERQVAQFGTDRVAWSQQAAASGTDDTSVRCQRHYFSGRMPDGTTVRDAGGNQTTGAGPAVTLALTPGIGTPGAQVLCTNGNSVAPTGGLASFAGCACWWGGRDDGRHALPPLRRAQPQRRELPQPLARRRPLHSPRPPAAPPLSPGVRGPAVGAGRRASP